MNDAMSEAGLSVHGLEISEVWLQTGQYWENEVPKSRVLCDEEAGGVSVCVLQCGLLLSCNVLLFCAVPRFLQTSSSCCGQSRVRSRAVYGLALQQSPLLFIQLRQNGHSGFVLEALSYRRISHSCT